MTTLTQFKSGKADIHVGVGGTTTLNITFTTSPAVGDTIVAVVGYFCTAYETPPSIVSISNGTDSLTQLVATSVGSSGSYLQLSAWGIEAITSTATEWTVTYDEPSSVQTIPLVGLYDINGLVFTPGGSFLDQFATAVLTADPTSASVTTPGTTLSASGFWIGATLAGNLGTFESSNSTVTGPAGGGWTNESQIDEHASSIYYGNASMVTGYQIPGVTGQPSWSATLSTATNCASIVISFPGGNASLPAQPVQPGRTWRRRFRPRAMLSPPPNPALPPPEVPYPQAMPGKTWKRHYRAGEISPMHPLQPGFNQSPVYRPSGVPADPGRTWRRRFKHPAQIISFPTPGVTVPISTATVTIATPAPGIPGVGLALGTCTVTISAPGIALGFALSPATVTIATPAPGISGVGVALGVCTLTIATPGVTPITIDPQPALPILPGKTWRRRFKHRTQVAPRTISPVYQPSGVPADPGKTWRRKFQQRRPPPWQSRESVYVPLGVCAVTIAVPMIGTPPVDVPLNPATVTITAYPVKPSRALLMSLATVAGTDDYGNAYGDGISVYKDAAKIQVHVNQSQDLPAIELPTGLATEQQQGSLYALPRNVGLANEQSTLIVQGPESTHDGAFVTIQLDASTANGSGAAANGQLVCNHTLQAYWDSAGLHISNVLYGAAGVITIGDVVKLAPVGSTPATPASGCLLFYEGGTLYALGPSGNPVAIATT